MTQHRSAIPKPLVLWGPNVGIAILKADAERTTPEGRAKYNAKNAEARATPEGKAAHIAATLAWQKANRGKATALVVAYYAAAKKKRIRSWTQFEEIARPL